MNVAPYKHRYSKNETTKKRPKVWKFQRIVVSLQRKKEDMRYGQGSKTQEFHPTLA